MPKAKEEPTGFQELLRVTFHYKDGTFYRKDNGKQVGFFRNGKAGNDYRCVSFCGYRWREHRLVWVYHNGPIPEGYHIDHINNVKYDNRIENLRLCTPQQNAFNMSLVSTNKTGYKGVSYDTATKSYRATIRVNKRTQCLGRYKTPEEAYKAYVKAAKEYHGEFFNDG